VEGAVNRNMLSISLCFRISVTVFAPLTRFESGRARARVIFRSYYYYYYSCWPPVPLQPMVADTLLSLPTFYRYYLLLLLLLLMGGLQTSA